MDKWVLQQKNKKTEQKSVKNNQLRTQQKTTNKTIFLNFKNNFNHTSPREISNLSQIPLSAEGSSP